MHEMNQMRVNGKNTVADWLSARSQGFTLIELLVVIAIISLLVSILLPSLQKAKDLAKTTICATQMHAFGQATLMYLQEYNQIPWYAPCLGPKYYSESWNCVLDQYAPGLAGVCPTQEARIGAHYGFNNFSGNTVAPFVYERYDDNPGTKHSIPLTLLETKDPANWALFLDAKNVLVYPPCRHNPDFDPDGNLTQAYCDLIQVRPRIHSNGCNVTLCDGHVEWVNVEVLFDIDASGKVSHLFWWRDRP